MQIFHNHGKEAGASLAHPHSQLIAIPVVSPYIQLELTGSERYFRKNKELVYGVIAEYESEAKTRVVYENEKFLAFCPFASRSAFEIHVMPKRSSPYFERIGDEEKLLAAERFAPHCFRSTRGLEIRPIIFIFIRLRAMEETICTTGGISKFYPTRPPGRGLNFRPA
ncbi:MAG: hypothetical protein IPL87_01805 [Candidatus Moraniibacteriota bacterium]|nr:MAG: hypothetical protein IPL87_01805 [Candidatus Moranbacteria bacterium]